MKEYKVTLIGLALASIVFLVTSIMNIDLFEIIVESLKSFEKYEIDEFIVPFFILFVFSFIDQLKRKKSQKIEYEKIKIYKAMLSSTHHILNNFLNQMQLFKITAENTPNFDLDILSFYDMVIKDASTQIGALGSITIIDEVSIHKSVEPK